TLIPDGTVGTSVTQDGFTLAADEKVWRLELLNLAGDAFFETYNDGDPITGWVHSGTASIAKARNQTGIKHGQYVELFDGSDTDGWAGFDPSTAGFILDGAAASNTYRVVFWTGQDELDYIAGSATGVNFELASTAVPVDGKFSLEPFSISSADTRGMFARSNGSQTAEIDDLRIVRFDIKESSSLRLYLAPPDTSPSLVPGRYEFSLWVRRPLDARFFDDPGRISDPGAPFAATKVRLLMQQVGFLEDVSTPLMFTGTFNVGDSWQRIAVRMGDGNLARFDESSSEPVLELAVYPYASDDMDVGAVEIAAPALRFFVDGYTD
ncbi:MAG: hypothetical protein JXM71_09300, partial [Spirochaetales bacterium]|nr:hypothetical protein [Spirochaetales bacterium]